MARRGSYGQLPGAAPNLTSTIIAIAEQFQQEREHNLMDAWKNGGIFEGKPVTDDMVLNFWRDRLKDVDKNDPLYDTYHNTLTQTNYAVSESKMSTWYAKQSGQDPKDDRRMAAFYTSWAAKVPKDSEWYRVLQRDAAQFIRSANAKQKVLDDAAAAKARRGGGGGGGRSGGLTKAQLKAKAYGDSQTATYVSHEQLGAFLTAQFTTAAKGQGLIGLGDSQDLADFDPNDPGKLLDVIDGINKNPNAVVYYTAGGAVTGQAILDQIKKLDPHFDGKLTIDYYGKALDSQLVGQHLRLDLAVATNHKGDITAINKSIRGTTETGREANAWGIEKSYQKLRNNFLRTWQDPNATPDSKLEAWTTYSGGLVALATNKSHPPDMNTYTRLMAEVNGDGNVDSLAESFTGLQGTNHSNLTGGTQGDITDTHASLQNLAAQHDAVAQGQAVWAIGTTDSQGVFHPGIGSEIGAAAPADVQGASPEGAVQVWVTQHNGKAIPVWVSGKTITAQVVDSDGFKVGATNPNETKVGVAYDVSVEGHTERLYAYKSPGGQTLYTTDPPWGPQVQVHDTGGALQLTVKLGGVPSDETVGRDPNFSVVKNADGQITSITVDPARLVLTATDPIRHAAGPDPHTDSLSPKVAYLMASPQGRAELANLQNDAAFRHSVDVDLHLAAGGQYDPATGYIVGGDPAIYNEAAAQVGFAARMDDPRTRGLGPAGGELFFGRSTTRGAFEVNGPTFDQTQPPPLNYPSMGTDFGPSGRVGYVPPKTLLPSDAARGSLFGALAGAFEPGTNRLLPPQPAGVSEDALTITAPTRLKVPAAPTPSNVAPKSVAPNPTPVTPPPAVPVPVQPVVPPGPTDTVTPIPVLPVPTPVVAPNRPGGGDVTSGTGGLTPTAVPKPNLAAPKPLPPPRTGQRPQ